MGFCLMRVDAEADALIHRLIEALRNLLAGETDEARVAAEAALDAARDAGFSEMEG